jgi:hypothetical protein
VDWGYLLLNPWGVGDLRGRGSRELLWQVSIRGCFFSLTLCRVQVTPTMRGFMMDTFTHDDCGFASDASVGACEGEVWVPIDYMVEPGLPLCETGVAG